MSKTTIFLNQSTLTDLFTIVYVLVDDYLLASVTADNFTLPQQEDQKGSYAELMTIALVGDVLGKAAPTGPARLLKQAYTGSWFDFIKVEYSQLFPVLPDRTRYHRILNHLERIFADFALRFPPQQTADEANYIIDSKALPICKGVRWGRPRAMTEADSGRGSLGMFYGFKLHAIVDDKGLICRFAVVPANAADPTVAEPLLAASSAFVLGDKGYPGCGVYAQPKANERQPRLWGNAFSWVRKTIETVFSSLVRSRHLVLGQLNSFRSIRARVCRKIAAHNLAWFLLH